MREDVQNLKVKFATLLDLCGIKDADIPIFEEPLSVCTRQSLITNFCTMSKKSPRSTPKLTEPVLRDPAVYGDLLLNYLLAQTDSDTSSRPDTSSQHDDSVTSADAGTEPEVPTSSNVQRNPLDSPRQQSLSPSQTTVHELSYSHEGIQTLSNFTIDSDVTGSDHSNIAVDCYSQQLEPQLHNRTSGSTPELPASQSSTCLDIMYASLFDSMESPDSVDLPAKGDTAPEETFVTPRTVERRISQPPRLSSCEEPSPAEHSCMTPVTTLHCQMKSQSDISDQEDIIFCEPLVVCLPPDTNHKSVDKCSLKMDKHKLKVDKQHSDHKLTLVGSNPGVEQCMESEIPPLPPRMPMTDAKMTSSTNHAFGVEVCHTGSRGIKSYYSEKKMRRSLQKSPSYETLKHGCCKSKQGGHCAQCEHGHQLFSACSRHNHQHDPDATVVASPPHSNQHSRKPHSKKPQASVTRSGSASKRRRGNDKLPVQNSHQDRMVSSARQRLQFVSPVRSRDNMSSDSGKDQVVPITSHSQFATDHVEQPKKVQAYVCRMLSNHQPHKMQLPQQCTSQSPRQQHMMQVPQRCTSQSPRKTVRKQYKVVTCNNITASKAQTSASYDPSSTRSLPTRQIELMDRQAYYRDLMDRDIGCYPSSRSSSNKDSKSPHSLDLERTVRTVEGSDSPSNVPFKIPPAGMRAPRGADKGQWHARVSSRGVSAGSGCSNMVAGGHWKVYNSSKMTFRSDSSSQDYPSSSDSPRLTNTRSSLSSRSSSRSSKSSSSQKSHKYRSHPIASSTLLFDSSYISPVRDTVASPEQSTIMNQERSHKFRAEEDTMASPDKFQNFNPDRCSTIASLEGEAGSIITWTINDEFSDFLDTSFNHPSAESSRRFTKRKSLHMDKGRMMALDDTIRKMPLSSTVLSHSTLTDSSSFVSPPVAAAPQRLPVKLNSTADKCIIAASHSFMQAVNTATTQKCIDSDSHTGTSMRRYNVKALIVCSPGKEKNMPENNHLPQSKHISASEPDLRYPCPEVVVEEDEYSCVPTDTDSTSDSLAWEHPPSRPRRPSTSSSSSCTAARCRPILLTAQLSEVAPDATSLLEEYSSVPDDLMDSILTDSPRSVNSSGIFAPHNSYTSPVRSADSQKSYSSSSISADANQTVCHEYPIIPPPTPYKKSETDTSVKTDPPSTPYNKTLTERSSFLKMDSTSTPCHKTLTDKSTLTRADPRRESREYSSPFTPLSHVSQTPTRLTRNQGVTAEAQSTPHRPQAVVEASRKGYPVMPPPVVIPAPPKIKNKTSLVRKIKQISSHLFRH